MSWIFEIFPFWALGRINPIYLVFDFVGMAWLPHVCKKLSSDRKP
jgi:hypothetical protein